MHYLIIYVNLQSKSLKEKERILKKIENDATRPVLFSESKGGSESQLRLLFKFVPDEYFKNINLILNNTDESLIDNKKINILWVHHYINQKEVRNLKNQNYLDKIDYFVFNSNWNFKQHQYKFKIPSNKSVVIRNAIEEITSVEKSKDKINLVYHTTPWRGLNVLISAFKKLDVKDVELHICSSTIIYGKKFHSNFEEKFKEIFDECKKLKNTKYHGFVEHSNLIELLQKMHIFSYPSIWPETSCIAAIEAMAAGCEVVTTNLGALDETCSPFGKFVDYDNNLHILEKKFLKTLQESIENYWSDDNQKKLKLQKETINKSYSWNVRKNEWIDFLKKIKS